MEIKVEQNGNQTIVRIIGSIDALNSEEVQEKVLGLIDGCDDLVLDFSELEYISSSGLRMLINAQKKMNEKKGNFKVTNINDFVEDVLRLTGFTGLINVE